MAIVKYNNDTHTVRRGRRGRTDQMCVWGTRASITDVYMRVTCRLSYNLSTVSGFQMAYYYYELMALDTFLLIPFHHVV